MSYTPTRGPFKGKSFKNKYQYRKHRLNKLLRLTPREYTRIRSQLSYRTLYNQQKQRGIKTDSIQLMGAYLYLHGKYTPSQRLIRDYITEELYEQGEIPSPEVYLTDYLVIIGNREPDDPWEPGETPQPKAA